MAFNNNIGNADAFSNTDVNQSPDGNWGYLYNVNGWIPPDEVKRTTYGHPSTLYATSGSLRQGGVHPSLRTGRQVPAAGIELAQPWPMPQQQVHPSASSQGSSHSAYAQPNFGILYGSALPDVNVKTDGRVHLPRYHPAPGLGPALLPLDWSSGPLYWQTMHAMGNTTFNNQINRSASGMDSYSESTSQLGNIPRHGWFHSGLAPAYKLSQDELFSANNGECSSFLSGTLSPAYSASSSSSSSTPVASPSAKMQAGLASPSVPSMAPSARASTSLQLPSPTPSPPPGWQPAYWPNGEEITSSEGTFAFAEQPSTSGGLTPGSASPYGAYNTLGGQASYAYFLPDHQGQAASQTLVMANNASAEAAQEEDNSFGLPPLGTAVQPEPGSSTTHPAHIAEDDRDVTCYLHPCNGQVFNRPHDLHRHHMSRIHNNNLNTPRFHCRFCLGMLARRDLVLRHKSYKDKAGNERTSCPRIKFQDEVDDIEWEIQEEKARNVALRFAEAGIPEWEKDPDVVMMTRAMGRAAREEFDRRCPILRDFGRQRVKVGGGFVKEEDEPKEEEEEEEEEDNPVVKIV